MPRKENCRPFFCMQKMMMINNHTTYCLPDCLLKNNFTSTKLCSKGITFHDPCLEQPSAFISWHHKREICSPGCLSPFLQHQYPKLLFTPLGRNMAQSTVSPELLLKQIKAVRSSCDILPRQDDKGHMKLQEASQQSQKENLKHLNSQSLSRPPCLSNWSSPSSSS